MQREGFQNKEKGKIITITMEKKQDEQLKCKTNIPELVEFKTNDPVKTGTGQYGEWWMYGVVNRGVDKVFFPTKFLYDKIQGFSPIQGKTLEIVLIEIDGGKKDWVVKNTDGTLPKSPVSSNSAHSSYFVPKGDDMTTRAEFDALSARIEKMAEWAKKTETAYASLDSRIKKLEIKDEIDIPVVEPKTTVPGIDITFPEGFLK